MKRLAIFFLLFSIFSHADILNDNLIKVRVIVNSREYISYVMISSDELVDCFYVIKESL